MQEIQDFQLNSSLTTPYAFTLRRTTTKVDLTREIYEAKLSKIRDMGINITDHVYETTAGLHCHGVMQVPKKFYMKRLRTRGWRIQLDEIYDYAGWLAYITKEHMLVSIVPNKVSDPVTDSPKDPDFTMPRKKLF